MMRALIGIGGVLVYCSTKYHYYLKPTLLFYRYGNTKSVMFKPIKSSSQLRGALSYKQLTFIVLQNASTRIYHPLQFHKDYRFRGQGCSELCPRY